ncbi:hypothetical protein F5884DRAFT_61756 [Xylogone sp. PMI_703]|nr:hypothetical protein F5884DRAFT_61756 [Xylogone sp. PMI_703]
MHSWDFCSIGDELVFLLERAVGVGVGFSRLEIMATVIGFSFFFIVSISNGRVFAIFLLRPFLMLWPTQWSIVGPVFLVALFSCG